MAGLISYSKTQRIVLLIDLNPILHSPDPEPYIAAVVSAAKTLLSFPPLSSSLFSFKLFFSSLSPLLSSSKLASVSLSFDLPDSTLASLLRALDALKVSNFDLSSSKSSRGSYIASSLRQIVHDYAWDLVVRDPVIGTVLGCDFSEGINFIRSNLVVLFSPISRELNCAFDFLCVGADDEGLRDLGLFKSKFRGVFGTVAELFDARDIHCSWIDVKFGLDSADKIESGSPLGLLESGIKDLGWGFCSSDSVILGSAVVPFGLIYPTIAISPDDLSSGSDCLKFQAQTSLEILDVNSKPLECKCGELELVYSDILSSSTKKQCKESFVKHFYDGCAKLRVKALRCHEGYLKLQVNTCDTLFVRESSGKSDLQDQESGFYADRVLQTLARETSEFVVRKQEPIWQILLSYLYREGYCAVVSLSNGNGHSCTGILRPFTVSSAIIYILQNGVSIQNAVQECITVKRKQSQKSLHMLQELSWAEFCRAALDHPELALEDIYLKRFGSSKKFKFLKCWIKQLQKSSISTSVTNSVSKPSDETEADATQRMINLSQETEPSIHLSASEEENTSSSNPNSRTDNIDTPVVPMESLESFFSSLPGKIKQGVESEEIDLRALAQGLVTLCIFYLFKKYREETDFQSETTELNFKDDANSAVVTEELTNLLLKDVRDLVGVHKKKNSSCKASETEANEATEAASESIVREYELQIIFRMEIMETELGRSLETSAKHKFVKQICYLLEAIQCHLDSGFFGDWSLDKYVGKIIKSRYHHSLGDVVDKIYTKMDLLLFTEDDESLNSLMNSEENSQVGGEKGENDVLYTNHRSENENEEEQMKTKRREEEAAKLVKAQERRERARRFASFTSWMPDLQRVWAPKHSKAVKVKPERSSTQSKRKNKERSCDTVCETPLTANKRSSYSRVVDSESEDGTDHVSRPGGCSVSKALFQDD